MRNYSGNGWQGCRYDAKLTAKEIAAKVREYVKKELPGWRFSVRSGWSTYTPHITVTLTGGPVQALNEGAAYCSSAYDEKRLTPAALEAVGKVMQYLNSYNYDNSNGMIDYYDTAFFTSFRCDAGAFRLIPAKTTQARPAVAASPADAAPVEVSGLELIEYSARAVAVFGDTKSVREELKALGGRFNSRLAYEGKRRAGWVFSASKADAVRVFLKGISPAAPAASDTPAGFQAAAPAPAASQADTDTATTPPADSDTPAPAAYGDSQKSQPAAPDTFGQAVEKAMYNLTPAELEEIAEGNRCNGWGFTRDELEETESEYRQAASTGDHHAAALLVSALEDCNYHGFCRALLAGDFEAYRRELDEVSPILEAYGASEKSLIRVTA